MIQIVESEENRNVCVKDNSIWTEGIVTLFLLLLYPLLHNLLTLRTHGIHTTMSFDSFICLSLTHLVICRYDSYDYDSYLTYINQ